MIPGGLFFCWCFSLLRCLGFVVVIRPLRSQLKVSGMLILTVSLSLFFVFACRGIDVLSEAARWNALPQSVELGLKLAIVAAAEFALGALIGFPCALILEALLQSARLGDVIRGAHYAEQISASGKRVSMFENLIQVAILAVGVPLAYPGAVLVIKHSMMLVPLGSFGFSSFFSGPENFDMLHFDILHLLSAESFIELGNKALVLSCLAVSSVLIGSVLLDVFLGMLSRVMGRANVFVELMPLKLILGIVLGSMLILQPPTVVKQSLFTAITYKILER